MSDEARDARERLVGGAVDAMVAAEDQAHDLLDLWCSPEHRDDLARLADLAVYEREHAVLAHEEKRLCEEELGRARAYIESLLWWMERANGGDPTLTSEEYYVERDSARVFLARLDKENQG